MLETCNTVCLENIKKILFLVYLFIYYFIHLIEIIHENVFVQSNSVFNSDKFSRKYGRDGMCWNETRCAGRDECNSMRVKRSCSCPNLHSCVFCFVVTNVSWVVQCWKKKLQNTADWSKFPNEKQAGTSAIFQRGLTLANLRMMPPITDCLSFVLTVHGQHLGKKIQDERNLPDKYR